MNLAVDCFIHVDVKDFKLRNKTFYWKIFSLPFNA